MCVSVSEGKGGVQNTCTLEIKTNTIVYGTVHTYRGEAQVGGELEQGRVRLLGQQLREVGVVEDQGLLYLHVCVREYV